MNFAPRIVIVKVKKIEPHYFVIVWLLSNQNKQQQNNFSVQIIRDNMWHPTTNLSASSVLHSFP